MRPPTGMRASSAVLSEREHDAADLVAAVDPAMPGLHGQH